MYQKERETGDIMRGWQRSEGGGNERQGYQFYFFWILALSIWGAGGERWSGGQEAGACLPADELIGCTPGVSLPEIGCVVVDCFAPSFCPFSPLSPDNVSLKICPPNCQENYSSNKEYVPSFIFYQIHREPWVHQCLYHLLSISSCLVSDTLQLNGDIGTVGISQHACDALGDVVFVGFPSVGDKFSAGWSPLLLLSWCDFI